MQNPPLCQLCEANLCSEDTADIWPVCSVSVTLFRLHCVGHKLMTLLPQVILSGENIADDVSTPRIADKTEGFSGSDLRQLCTAAAMCGIRDLMKATSKAAKASAASKSASSQQSTATKHAAAVAPVKQAASDSSEASTSTSAGATAALEQQSLSSEDTTAAAAQQPGQDQQATAGAVDASTAASISGRAGAEKAELTGNESRKAAAQNGTSTAGTAGKHNKGSKRDSEATADSSSTKRRKSHVDEDAASNDKGTKDGAGSLDTLDDVAQQPHGVTDPDTLPASTSHAQQQRLQQQRQTNDPSAESDKDAVANDGKELQLTVNSNGTPAADSQTSWLLAKFHDVATAADQEVRLTQVNPLHTSMFVSSVCLLTWQQQLVKSLQQRYAES